MNFPNPEVNVDCSGKIISPEACPNPTDFKADGCSDSVIIETKPAKLQSLGRIVQVDVPVRNVCPGKRVAVGIILTETDDEGIEHTRGMKTVLIPAQSGDVCQDLLIKCVNFVVPESLDLTGNKNAICNERAFRVRVMANYIDTDFVCCDPETSIIKS